MSHHGNEAETELRLPIAGVADDAPTPEPEVVPPTRELFGGKGIKKGECRNPTGANGFRRAQARVARFMAEVAQCGKEPTRMDRVLLAAYASALLPGQQGAQDRRMLIEQCVGKARLSDAEFQIVLAEHMRKVARDGADLAIKILGTRIYSMGPKELAEFFRECGGNPAGFLEAAKCAEEQARAPDATLPDAPEEAQESAAPVLPDSDEGWPKP